LIQLRVDVTDSGIGSGHFKNLAAALGDGHGFTRGKGFFRAAMSQLTAADVLLCHSANTIRLTIRRFKLIFAGHLWAWFFQLKGDGPESVGGFYVISINQCSSAVEIFDAPDCQKTCKTLLQVKQSFVIPLAGLVWKSALL
jgi:hypothetical protein